MTLALEAGKTTALLGRSGSGKTTLLRMVNGLVVPTSGRVLVGGRQAGRGIEEQVALRRGIGYVIQETGLFPHMTVERNAGMALELAGRRVANVKGEFVRCWGWRGWTLGSFGGGIRGSFRGGSGSGLGWLGRWRMILR